jgi:muramoyltetrapeptide carboxypeptidase
LKKIPASLKKGDTVAIIASARSTKPEEMEPAIEILKNWGLNPVMGPNIFSVHHQFAGSDEERAADLQWALDKPEIKAVILARGGYGTVRLIDRVHFNKFIEDPKWIVGYSDATILQSHLFNLGIASVHGTMAFQMNRDEEATESLRKVLFGEKVEYETEVSPLNRKGKAKGEIAGGNLSLIYALSGTASDIHTKDKILFIEDLDEQLYHIDRMMHQLKRSGKLKELKGLIVGGMTEMKDNKVPFGKTAEEIIAEAVSEYNYPVCFNFSAGHIKRNLAFYIGKEAELDVNEKGGVLKYV